MRKVSRWFVVVIVACAATCGCGKKEEAKPGHWVPCTCPYLTDYDDVAKHQLEVCVPEGAKAQERAFGCASQLTHGPSEPCTCGTPLGPCDGKELCRSKEYK